MQETYAGQESFEQGWLIGDFEVGFAFAMWRESDYSSSSLIEIDPTRFFLDSRWLRMPNLGVGSRGTSQPFSSSRIDFAPRRPMGIRLDRQAIQITQKLNAEKVSKVLIDFRDGEQ